MKHKESHLQQACVAWFRMQYPDKLLFAIPNGGKRNLITAMILKREGVLAGVADLFLSEPSGDYHGLYVEMKTDKGKQSDHQVIFEHKATGLGYKYVVCKSLDSFMDEVRSYLNG